MKEKIVFGILALLVTFSLFSDNKTALVIGNGTYQHFQSLSSTRPEAISMKNTLETLGFEVVFLLDGTYDQMYDAIATFELKLRQRGGIGLFHYGGHGVQVDGENYLLPVEKDIPDERRVRSRAVNAREIVDSMATAGTKTNIIILDACRDNPLPAETRSTSMRGLTRLDAPINSIIVYSAEAGKTAEDGIFTPALIEQIKTPGMRFRDVLDQVRKIVYNKTGGKQIPGEYNQLFEPVFLSATKSSYTIKPQQFDPKFILVGAYGGDGYQKNSTACYWIDSNKYDLSIPSVEDTSSASSVFIYEGSVYISGSYGPKYDQLKPCYWVDGKRVDLPLPRLGKFGDTSSIFIMGGNVFIGGYFFTDSDYKTSRPCYWVNNKIVELSMPNKSGSAIRGSTSDIFISGNDVYTCGSISVDSITTPVYWINNDRTELSVPAGHSVSYATSIAIDNNDIHICGFSGESWDDQKIYYWKNGNRVALPMPPSTQISRSSEILINNNTVYISGNCYINKIWMGYYWKNNIRNELPIPNDGEHAIITDIIFHNNEIIISGNYGVRDKIPFYIENGKIIKLPGEDASIRAMFFN